MKFKKLIFIVACTSFIQLSSSEEPIFKLTRTPETRRTITSQDMFNLLIEFPFILTNICHEFGHALAAKILNNDPIDIHIGTGSFMEAIQNQYLFKVGPITFNGFRDSGYTEMKSSKNNVKEALVLINGPLFGFFASLFLYKYFLKKTLQQISSNNCKLTKSLIINITFAFIYFTESLYQLRYGFTPFNSSSCGDGYKLWKFIDKKEKYIRHIQLIYEHFGGCIPDMLIRWGYCAHQLSIKILPSINAIIK